MMLISIVPNLLWMTGAGCAVGVVLHFLRAELNKLLATSLNREVSFLKRL